jgi:hypothetical protein
MLHTKINATVLSIRLDSMTRRVVLAATSSTPEIARNDGALRANEQRDAPPHHGSNRSVDIKSEIASRARMR